MERGFYAAPDELGVEDMAVSAPAQTKPRSIKRVPAEPTPRNKVTIRTLRREDLDRGFLETLSALTKVDLTPAEARQVFATRPANSHTFVAVRNNRVVGTTSLLIDQKFIHGGGRVGHIEDVAVAHDAQRMGIGTALVEHAVAQAKEMGCYKVILHCFSDLSCFYKRLGFRDYNVGMRLDLPTS
jgi:glucosamine-phosphate N-acetyltransferase